jgi:DNA-binding transcriptional regulator YdaS (Cro superfamily)
MSEPDFSLAERLGVSPLDRTHMASGRVREIAHDLYAIAQAMARLGMSSLSEELREMSTELLDAAKASTRAFGEEIHGQLKHSQKENRDIMLALLERASPSVTTEGE